MARVAITDVTVVPMDTRRSIPARTVVVDGDRVETIAAAAELRPDGMRTVDGTGMYLMPGLADMHVHSWDSEESTQFLANGVTTVRNMWGTPYHLAYDRRYRAREIIGPRIVTASPIVDGLSEDGTTIWPNSHVLTEPAGALPYVERWADQGYRQVKAYQQLSRQNLSALGEAARRVGLKMTGHCPDGMTFEEAIEAGMTCFEHLTGVFTGHLSGVQMPESRGWYTPEALEVMRTIVAHPDLDALRALAARMAREEIWNCPTITVWQGGAQHPGALDNPLFDYEPEWMRMWWGGPMGMIPDDFRRDWVSVAREVIGLRIRVLGLLRSEGAPVVLGTDTPNPFVFRGSSIHDEIANFLSAGYSPFEALSCATREAARFMEESDDWGTVAEGKRADLLLVSGDPLSDPSVVRRPEAVFTNGFVLTRDDLDTMLAERARTVKQARDPGRAELDPPQGDVLYEKRYETRMFGQLSGRVCCRHSPLAAGARLVEERSAHLEGSRSVRSFLAPDLRLVRAEVDLETSMGAETWRVERTDTGYRAAVTTVDGYTTTTELESTPLFASDDFGESVLGSVLAGLPEGESTIEVLTVDRWEVGRVTGTVVRTHNRFEVRLDRLGTPSTLTYELDGDRLVSVTHGGRLPTEVREA